MVVDIDLIINSSNYTSKKGDCVNFAVAFKNIFGGDYLCCYIDKDDVRPTHATVVKNNNIYDSTGKISRYKLYDIVLEENSKYTSLKDHFKEPDYLKDLSLYQEEKSNKIEKILKRNLKQIKKLNNPEIL